jgi:hypothetical protein
MHSVSDMHIEAGALHISTESRQTEGLVLQVTENTIKFVQLAEKQVL